MRFKQFLEAQLSPYDHTPLEGEELVKAMRENCSRALESARAGDFIYRGSRADRVAGVYDPGSGSRKSQNTSNYYTMLLDTNPANDAFPKRGASFIASTRRAKAHGYANSTGKLGTLLYCFPFDETPIALVNEDDMWDLRVDFGLDLAGRYGSHDIADLNDLWEGLVGDMMLNAKDVASMADMISAIRNEHPSTIVACLRREGFLHNADKAKMTEAEIVDKFADAIPKAFSYKNLGCTLTRADELPTGSCEVWFSGKCVMVPSDVLDDLREEFGL